MSEELKPCPFCGNDGVLEILGGPGSTYRIAKCSKCKCDMHFYPTEEMAIAKWNTRAGAHPARPRAQGDGNETI